MILCYEKIHFRNYFRNYYRKEQHYRKAEDKDKDRRYKNFDLHKKDSH